MTFSWRELPEGNFLRWMVVHLISGDRINGNNDFETLSKITKDFTEVNLTIQINGVEVPVDSFVEAIELNMNHIAKREAAEIVENNLDGMRDKMYDIENALSEAHQKVLISVENVLSL